jgi:ubiquinone biosynthesis accessory factor UbiJ
MAGAAAMRLPAAWYSWFENAVNGYLALDPEFPPRLDALHGKTLRLEITGMNLDLYIGIDQRRVTLRQHHAGPADAEVRGAPLGLLNLLHGGDPMALVREGRIELRGDVQLARDFKKVLDTLDIDWEEKLSRGIGDWPARRIGILASGFDQWRRRSGESLHRSMGEYLQEETRLLPGRIEIENFVFEVDSLREGADRLEAAMDLVKPDGERS